jgi:hypothetical protein
LNDKNAPFALKISADDVLNTAAVAADVVLEVAQDLPMVAAAATVLRKLIDVYSAMRCSKAKFVEFKNRMERIYKLYFSAEGQC